MHFLPLLFSLLTLFSITSKAYVLKKSYHGQSLLNSFNFESGQSQNNGLANYVNAGQARKEGLASVSKHGGAVTLKTSTQQKVSHRDSVRLISKDSFNQGLFIFDIQHMPAGCGNWGSLWLVGPNWPNSGEIDVIEGVHDFATNAMSSHTAGGCTQQHGGFSGSFMMQGNQQNNCDVHATNSQGCGVRSNHHASFGSAFNKNGGGVYALKWDNGGIATYFFPRHSIPKDIKSGKPNPGKNWGTPQNFVAPNNCHPSQHFKNMNIVINNDLCGTWAAGVWNQDTSYAGQKGSCAASTGSRTCNAYVQNRGDKFKQAFWTINSIKVYN